MAFAALWIYGLKNHAPLELSDSFLVIMVFNLMVVPTKLLAMSANCFSTALASFKRIELIWKAPKFENRIGLDGEKKGTI